MASSATALLDRSSPHSGHGDMGEDFASLLDESMGREAGFEGSVVTGRVVTCALGPPVRKERAFCSYDLAFRVCPLGRGGKP